MVGLLRHLFAIAVFPFTATVLIAIVNGDGSTSRPPSSCSQRPRAPASRS